MDLDFSESYKQTNISLLSPNSQFIAIVVDFRLIIRSCQTLSILHLFSCTDLISCIQWSPDSNLIACASLKLGNIHIWSLSDPKFSCSINEGVAGLSKMFFGDCRHLLTIDDFALRITVWSLIDGSCNYIQFPKYIEKGYCFRCDSQYFAVVERRDCKDLVNVYNTADQWSLEKEWTVDTFDLADICWSPDGRYIAAWESVLFKVLLYYPDGRLVSVYEVDSGLGIKSVQWSPSAQFLAIGIFV